MVLQWIYCFLCDGEGNLDIGDNYNKFFENKVLQCPCCDGKGRLALKYYSKDPRNAKPEDYL